MDNLKTLFDKKQYKLIIDLTSSSDDVTSIIFRLNAFIALEDYKSALNLIINRKDIIYQKDPIRCMDIHIDLLLHENKLMDAINAINEYKNMPYISQKVEEHLKELPNRIKLDNSNINLAKEFIPVDERTPRLGVLEFENIIATNAKVSAAYFLGLPESKIEAVIMRNVDISFGGEDQSGVPIMCGSVEEMSKRGIVAENVTKLILENVSIKGQDGLDVELIDVDEVERN